MLSRDLKKLEPGSYVIARFDGEEETVRFRELRGPTERELHYGSTSNKVEIRRFLLGGYLDTYLALGDILRPTEPDPGILAAIKYVEAKVGPKPPPRPIR